LAECVVGDITPHDNVADKDKHQMEVEAMEMLVRNLSPSLADMFKTAFNRSGSTPTQTPLPQGSSKETFTLKNNESGGVFTTLHFHCNL
jgi:5'-deoxynucleotidase YfbR-like HD superfamily hydrolase